MGNIFEELREAEQVKTQDEERDFWFYANTLGMWVIIMLILYVAIFRGDCDTFLGVERSIAHNIMGWLS